MFTQKVKHSILYGSVIIAGILVSKIFLITPIQQKIHEWKNPIIPTPTISEEKKELTPEEKATMSGSFIQEFESLVEEKNN